MRAQLLAPLPIEALKQHPTRPYLTTINSIYVTERLNEVFGLGGWTTKVDIIKDDGEWVVVQVHFTATYSDDDGVERTIERNAFGGNDNEDIGDRYKGAVTDALTKIGSLIGVGAHVWMNQGVPRQAPRDNSPARPMEQKFQPTTEPTEWLNIIDKRSGKYTDLGLEYCERVKSGETSIKQLRTQFKISRADADAIERYATTKGPAPSPDEWENTNDNLPF